MFIVSAGIALGGLAGSLPVFLSAAGVAAGATALDVFANKVADGYAQRAEQLNGQSHTYSDREMRGVEYFAGYHG